MKSNLRNQAGFTLIEVMVAVVILLIVASSVGSFLTQNTRSFYNIRNDISSQSEALFVMNRLANGIPGIDAGTGLLAGRRIIAIEVDSDYAISSLTLLEADGTQEEYFVNGNELSFRRGSETEPGILISSNIISIKILPIQGQNLISEPTTMDYTKLDGNGKPLTTGVEVTVTTQVPIGRGSIASITNRYYFRNME